jgi:hypothetical protein
MCPYRTRLRRKGTPPGCKACLSGQQPGCVYQCSERLLHEATGPARSLLL